MADVFVQVLLPGPCQSGSRHSSRILVDRNGSIHFRQHHSLLLTVNSLLYVDGSLVSSREAEVLKLPDAVQRHKEPL